QLKEESAWADFQTVKPTKSSVVWTSIATGKTMLKHGILDFAFMKDNNIKLPFSNSEKRVPSMWQMLDLFGMRSVVINYYVSDPPDQINGVVVSDRFRRLLNQKPELINNYVDSVYPSIKFYSLKKLVRRDYREVLQRIAVPDFPELYQKIHPDKDYRKSFALQNSRSFVAQDALIENVTDYLFKTEKADLYISYFRLPDILQHFILHLLPDDYFRQAFGGDGKHAPAAERQPEIMARLAVIMEPVYCYMERILAKYMNDPKFKDAYFLVMSDHGFSLFSRGYDHYDLPDDMPAPPGILLIKGPAVRPGKISRAGIFDITPTVLYLFGLPLDKSMDGQPLKDIFRLVRKIRYTSYVLNKNKKFKHHQDADREAIEELKSLGYIH
ncbi:MAG: alkaline phosphatase family protein, partial [Candidatus Aureabacteria bacterium]|nr:alkaline phosphatase family protein [Candidatus Auribacterota bacterium]